MKKTTFTTTIAGTQLTADFSDLTEQAGGSVLLTYGETVILVTAVMSDRTAGAQSYFPLSVEFEEKFYAAGAILGSRFQRREGRPSDEAILSARMVDRTIRPLFDHRIRNDVQVVITVLAMGEDDPDVLGIIGASLALSVSPIPWAGPIGAVRIGRRADTKELVINPTYTERALEVLDYEVLACGQNGSINMIETAAQEISETEILTALTKATEVHQTLEGWQKEVMSEIGVEKITLAFPDTPSTITELYHTAYADRLYQTIFSARTGKRHIQALKDAFVTEVETDGLGESSQAAAWFETQIDNTLHHGVVIDGKRADGREVHEVRPLYAQAGGVSPVLHGSGIFYRGGTHIFSALTLGGPDDAQVIDTIEARDGSKRFLHHYNFPPFSVGETGRVGGFNRRMIGHGALAEKALLPVIPDAADFPYTIRLVSETMASNGSSSMGSVCASSLALMDGGVPIARAVAGIASGVMIVGDAYTLLTDIQGPEDEHGDMDFKVAGTTAGITAIQMDVKVSGIPLHILEEALVAAQEARVHILNTMDECIATPRPTVSDRAPHITRIMIAVEQIGLVIGSGGKTINGIKDATGAADITIEDDGAVYISGHKEAVRAAVAQIEQLTKVYEIGERYTATITTITDFGAFATFDEGRAEGLIHISEIASHHVANVKDELSIGDTVDVVVIKNENGKVGLSIKQVATLP